MTGYRWLLAVAAGLALTVPARPCAAQFDATTSGRSGAGTQRGPSAYQPPPPLRPGQPISVLVFPFGYEGEEPMPETPPASPDAEPEMPAAVQPDTATPTPEGMEMATSGLSPMQQQTAAFLTAAVKAGFLATPAFNVTTYRRNSSLVQAAVGQHDILKTDQVADVISPATGAVNLEKAKTIAHRLGIQTILLGTIDMQQDPMANSVEITVTTQLIDSTSGGVLRTAVVSGAAAGAEGVPMIAVQERAALDAAQKVLPAMGIQLVPVNSEEAPKAAGKRNGRRAASRASASNPDREAQKAERAAREAAKREAEQARKAAAARLKAEKAAARRNGKPAPAPELPAPASEDKEDLQPAQPPATQPAPAVQPAPNVSAPDTVRGTANEAGMPIPYGYALGDSKTAIPQRNRQGLKVPAWLGVAGFLAGLSFLL